MYLGDLSLFVIAIFNQFNIKPDHVVEIFNGDFFINGVYDSNAGSIFGTYNNSRRRKFDAPCYKHTLTILLSHIIKNAKALDENFVLVISLL